MLGTTSITVPVQLIDNQGLIPMQLTRKTADDQWEFPADTANLTPGSITLLTIITRAPQVYYVITTRNCIYLVLSNGKISNIFKQERFNPPGWSKTNKIAQVIPVCSPANRNQFCAKLESGDCFTIVSNDDTDSWELVDHPPLTSVVWIGRNPHFVMYSGGSLASDESWLELCIKVNRCVVTFNRAKTTKRYISCFENRWLADDGTIDIVGVLNDEISITPAE